MSENTKEHVEETTNPANMENLVKIMHYGGVELLREFNILIKKKDFMEAEMLLRVAELGYNQRLLDSVTLRENPGRMREIIIQRIGTEEEAEISAIDSILDASEDLTMSMIEFNQEGK